MIENWISTDVLIISSAGGLLMCIGYIPLGLKVLRGENQGLMER